MTYKGSHLFDSIYFNKMPFIAYCATSCVFALLKILCWLNIWMTSVVCFFSLLLWQGSTPNELWLYTLLFILCWTHRLKENEMNEHVQLLSISFHSFYHFHHSFSLFNRILKVRVQHTHCCTHAQQWRKTINSQIPCLKLITSGNKSHYDKWISLQKPMDSIVSKFYLETKWSINHFRMAAHCANPNPCIHAKKKHHLIFSIHSLSFIFNFLNSYSHIK